MPHTTGESYSAPHPTSEGRDSQRRAHILRLHGCRAGADNEVLYFPTGDEDLLGNVVLFPGDVQDLRDRMFSAGHGEFSDYCLESTAKVLATKFPCHDVWIVLPKNHVHGVLASYDNFVNTDWASGGAVLEYLPDGSACQHLEALLSTAANAVRSLRRRGGATARPDTSLPLTLVGFSKGAVVLNQLVTELGWEAAPAALSPRTPNSSKRNDPRGDGDPARLMSNRKRTRVSLNDCGGGARLASSEGVLTNPPSPAVSWEGGRDGGERDGADTCNEASRGAPDGSGSRSHQDTTSSLWNRLCSTFGMSRFSKRLFSSASPASSPNASAAHEHLDAHGGGGWQGTDTDTGQNQPEENLTSLGSPSPRPAFTRDKRRRRKRTSVSSTEREDNANTDGAAARRLFGRVAAIHWVDGGNGGLAGGSFPTNMCSLARLAALPNLMIRVHGSPYQWGNNCRPFLAFEADAFLDSVEGFRQAFNAREGLEFAPSSAADGSIDGGNGSGSRHAEYMKHAASRVGHDKDGHAGACSEAGSGGAGTACDVKRVVYFESEQPSLDIHFRVLRELNTE